MKSSDIQRKDRYSIYDAEKLRDNILLRQWEKAGISENRVNKQLDNEHKILDRYKYQAIQRQESHSLV
jgi:hypothetical protein